MRERELLREAANTLWQMPSQSARDLAKRIDAALSRPEPEAGELGRRLREVNWDDGRDEQTIKMAIAVIEEHAAAQAKLPIEASLRQRARQGRRK